MKLVKLSFVRSLRAHDGAKQRKDMNTTQWHRDPLSHPDIARMSERERADLQFIPGAVKPE